MYAINRHKYIQTIIRTIIIMMIVQKVYLTNDVYNHIITETRRASAAISIM